MYIDLPSVCSAPSAHDRGLNADIDNIADILSYRRAPRTDSHLSFLSTILEPVFGPPDEHGNFILRVGDAPSTAFLAHHDTVERVSGRVALQIDPDLFISLSPQDTTSRCLGADDGAGMWLVLEMIRARRPGLYIIFADEETGCLGSRGLARSRPGLFNAVTAAISLDRHAKHGNQVITAMSGEVTASPQYAAALCRALGLGYAPSANGGSTDSRHLLRIGAVREATNISVGYRDHHTRDETLDFASLRALRDALIRIDFGELPTRYALRDTA